MIELHELSCHYGETVALDRVSLSVSSGEILGYLGPNGAGKTSTVRLLTGMMQPASGTARVAGFEVTAEPLEVKKRIGYVPESGAVYQSLSPMEYLQFVGRLYGMEERLLAARIEELAEFFQLSSHLHERMTTFSKGMKQKVVISSAILHHPDVLFFDEPLNGLDVNAALALKQLLRELAAQGKTIFYCSHILEVVEGLCHKVAILNQGKLVAHGSVESLKAMTQQPSLTDVFSHLTADPAQTDVVKALSNKLSHP